MRVVQQRQDTGHDHRDFVGRRLAVDCHHDACVDLAIRTDRDEAVLCHARRDAGGLAVAIGQYLAALVRHARDTAAIDARRHRIGIETRQHEDRHRCEPACDESAKV